MLAGDGRTHSERAFVTLLIVEASAAMSRLIRSLVGGLAVSVVECRHGADAMALCRSLQPDWVIIDLDHAGALPLVRQLQQAYPTLRLLVLGEDQPRLREAAERAGARVYLPKEHLTSLPQVLIGQTAPAST
jgi:CheY-like chemotaxis protein